MPRAGRLLMVILILGVGACTPPEAMRARGGGPGADVGNRSAVVEMHAGARPYYNTPCRSPIDDCATGVRKNR
jgi:hypothetical protein